MLIDDGVGAPVRCRLDLGVGPRVGELHVLVEGAAGSRRGGPASRRVGGAAVRVGGVGAGVDARAGGFAGGPVEPPDPTWAELFVGPTASRRWSSTVSCAGRCWAWKWPASSAAGWRSASAVTTATPAAELWGDFDPGGALDEAVAAVMAHRRAGAAAHPANTLARSRWLRAVVCARPSLVGAVRLAPVPPPLPLPDLTDNGAVPCIGDRSGGGRAPQAWIRIWCRPRRTPAGSTNRRRGW